MTNKGGRPAHHDGEVKKAAIAVRTAPSVRDALREAAEESGRSVTQEVEARLMASFDREGGKRSPETEQLLNRIGAEIAEIEALTRKRWHRDRKTAGAVLEMFKRRPISWIRVDDPFDDELVKSAWSKFYALMQERDRNEEALRDLGLPLPPANSYSRNPLRSGLFGNGAPGTDSPLNALLEQTKGRWRERYLTEQFDAPEQVKKAAILVIEHLERLDEQLRDAEAAYDTARKPYSDAESEGREAYLKLREGIARDRRARGLIPDISDIGLTRP